MWTPTRRPRRRRRWPTASTMMAAAIVAVAAAPDEPPQASQGPAPTHRGEIPAPAPPANAGNPPAPSPPPGDGATPGPEADTPGLVIPVAHGNGIPGPVLAAYQRATGALGASQPGCRLPLALLAAIGKIETGHARGGQVDAAGTTLRPILGPVLDGAGGLAAIPDTDRGGYDGDTRWDRAVGPMQFIPGTWARWASDGNADGRADPHNIHDATLAGGRYLCAGGRDLSTETGVRQAILSYNHSTSYLAAVLAWMAAYGNGTVAVPGLSGGASPEPGRVVPPQRPRPGAPRPRRPPIRPRPHRRGRPSQHSRTRRRQFPRRPSHRRHRPTFSRP